MRILSIAFAGLAQLVARNLAKVEVAGSNPVARAIDFNDRFYRSFLYLMYVNIHQSARWPSGKAEACKAFIPGSNPGLASIVNEQLDVLLAAFFIIFCPRACGNYWAAVTICHVLYRLVPRSDWG